MVPSISDAASWAAKVYDDKPLGLNDEQSINIDDVQATLGNYGEDRIVVVRGTDSWRETLTNFHAKQQWSSLIPRCQTHIEFEKDAVEIVDAFDLNWAEKRVWCIGHSRGGAVALIIAGYAACIRQFRDDRATVNAITFEAPRGGDIKYARYIKQHVAHLRFQVAGDIVPLLPMWPHYWHDRAPVFVYKDGHVGPISLLERFKQFPHAVCGAWTNGRASIYLHNMHRLSKKLSNMNLNTEVLLA